MLQVDHQIESRRQGQLAGQAVGAIVEVLLSFGKETLQEASLLDPAGKSVLYIHTYISTYVHAYIHAYKH